MSDSFSTTTRVIDAAEGRETIHTMRTTVPEDAVFAKVSRDDFGGVDEDLALFAQVSRPEANYPMIFMDRESVGYLAMACASPMPPHTGPEITLKGDTLQLRELVSNAVGHPELNTQIIHADGADRFQVDFGWVDWIIETLPTWELGQLVDAPGWGLGHVREIVTDGGKPYRVIRTTDDAVGCFHGDQLRDGLETAGGQYEPHHPRCDFGSGRGTVCTCPETWTGLYGIEELEQAYREASELLHGEAIDAAGILAEAVNAYLRDNAGANEYETTLTVRFRMVSEDLHGDVSDFAEETLPNALLELSEVLSVSGDGPRFAAQA